jgi:WD40 repeat protein
MSPHVVTYRMDDATTVKLEIEPTEGFDPAGSGEILGRKGHRDEVYAVCAVTVDGRALLASGSGDRTVRLWDPRDGGRLAVLEGHQGPVRAVCAVTIDGRPLLASGGDDDTVRLWDPHASICLLTAQTHHKVLALAGVADALAIGLDIGILVIKPAAVV